MTGMISLLVLVIKNKPMEYIEQNRRIINLKFGSRTY